MSEPTARELLERCENMGWPAQTLADVGFLIEREAPRRRPYASPSIEAYVCCVVANHVDMDDRKVWADAIRRRRAERL